MCYKKISEYINILADFCGTRDISFLNKEELKLLRLRYIDGMSQTTIAKNLNMSQVQVSRYETKIKTKLKQELM